MEETGTLGGGRRLDPIIEFARQEAVPSRDAPLAGQGAVAVADAVAVAVEFVTGGFGDGSGLVLADPRRLSLKTKCRAAMRRRA